MTAILYAALPVMLGLVGNLATGTVRPSDEWKPWLWAATALLAVSAVVATVAQQGWSQPADDGAGGPRTTSPSERVPTTVARAAGFNTAAMVTASLFLALAAALCAYILFTHPDWDLWTKADYAAVPVAACVAIVPMLQRRRWTFAGTAMVPAVIAAWPTTVWYLDVSGAAFMALVLGCVGVVVGALVVNYRKRDKGHHIGWSAKGAIFTLGGIAILASVAGVVLNAGMFLVYLPFIVVFGCVVIQTAWESDQAARRDAARTGAVFALLQAVYPSFALSGFYIVGTDTVDPRPTYRLLLLALTAILTAGVVVRSANARWQPALEA
ncbi:hypothetical protein [Micromonospora sp. A200]|uniref:hypothetical protein n=1 Tax=Micromonospora sp. A200 TaxID=2940568 RepID=UPI002476FC78|nr:hypothetical protein [Micromonospora sp. A200]